MTVDDVRSLVDRVQAAINAHDLEAFLACFDETYDSEQRWPPLSQTDLQKRLRAA
jgi:hypothetical protein